MANAEDDPLKNNRLNPAAVGIFYFLLFALANILHSEFRLFRFPVLDGSFLRAVSIDVGLGLALGLAIVAISALLVRFNARMRALAGEFRKMVGPVTTQEIFFLSAFSAVGEEFMFRGVVQAAFGWIPASLLFGLLHIGPGKKYLPWTLFAVVVGFLLGGLYEWRGDLFAPTAAHFVVNFLNFRLLSRETRLVPNSKG